MRNCCSSTVHTDSDNPSSCNDRDKLFEMSQIEQVLRDRKHSVVSVSGRGRLDKAKIVYFMKCTLWVSDVYNANS